MENKIILLGNRFFFAFEYLAGIIENTIAGWFTKTKGNVIAYKTRVRMLVQKRLLWLFEPKRVAVSLFAS